VAKQVYDILEKEQVYKEYAHSTKHSCHVLSEKLLDQLHVIEQSRNLLLAFSNTAILGFGPRRNP
jgi:hypothetical protein